MEIDQRLLRNDEIAKKLWKALVEKTPLPPSNWTISKLNDEILHSAGEFEADQFLRQKDALETAVFYLTTFANGMPERVNLTASNQNVVRICDRLTNEIERITFCPETVIAERGKLKAWLVAILAAGTCWIYQQETARSNSEKASEKVLKPVKVSPKRDRSDLAAQLLQTVFSKRIETPRQDSNQQGSLF